MLADIRNLKALGANFVRGYRRPKLPVVAAVRDAFRGLP